MNKHLLWILSLLAALFCAVNAAAEDTFHSEFGILPPEFPTGSGTAAEQLDAIVYRVQQEGLPPSHQMRTLYEWMMRKYSYDAADSFVVTDDLTEEDAATELCRIFLDSSAGDGGYALISHYFMERMGWPTVIVSGELQLPDGEIRTHQWNYVLFSGEWYHFDPLGEMLNPALNGFMNVEKALKDGPLHWDADVLPESGAYAVRALGCACAI